MRVLFDQGTPVPLRRMLVSHVVITAYENGWSDLRNGDLLRVAEAHAFEALVTTDTNLKYQQNLRNRNLAIVVLMSASWPRIREHAASVVAAVDGATPGAYVEVPIPRSAPVK